MGRNEISESGRVMQVTTSMYDLCFDTLGVEKRKRSAQDIKSNRGSHLLALAVKSVLSDWNA